MQPLSLDLRQRIINVHKQKMLSVRQIAKRFDVAKSCVQKLIKQYKETGNIHPKRQGGNVSPKVQGEDLVPLVEIIENNNDATLGELCDLLKDKTKITISRATMGRISNNLDYTVKKNSSCG